MGYIRVLLADDHQMVGEGIRKLVESDCVYECVGTVADGRTLLRESERLHPDIILVDISLPLLNGLDAARLIKQKNQTVKLIFITMHAERMFVMEAFRAGAAGYLLKSCSSSELFFALEEVRKGRIYITPTIARDFVEEALRPSSNTEQKPPAARLTTRQRRILELIAKGFKNKAIAATLGISCKTVEFHRKQLERVLGIRTTAELTRYACAHQIVPLQGSGKDAEPVRAGGQPPIESP